MRRLCFGLWLVGFVVVAHAAQPEDSFVSEPDPLTTLPARSNAYQLPPHRFSTSVVLSRSADTAPVGFGFSGASILSLFVDSKKETSWTSKASSQQNSISISGYDRATLSPVLRDVPTGEPPAIKPQRNSIWMLWRKAFP